MSEHDEFLALKAEVGVLKRQITAIMDKLDISSEEVDNIEMEALLDEAARTGNYKPMQDYLRRKVAKRKEKSGE
jgi:hypothetical protein